MLASVETVIVDEIHAVAGSKRGAHLALSLERLEHVAGRACSASACPRPSDRWKRWLASSAGGREVTIIDAGERKQLDLEVMVPVEDMRELGAAPTVEGEPRASIWPAMYPQLLELVRAHRSTIVFVNNRRSAERVASRLNELAERVGGACASRLDRPRAARSRSRTAEGGRPAGDRGHLLAGAGHRHGRCRSRGADRVAASRWPPGCSASAGPATRSASPARAVLPQVRGDLLEAAVVTRRMREGEIEHDARAAPAPGRARAADSGDVSVDEWSVG